MPPAAVSSEWHHRGGDEEHHIYASALRHGEQGHCVPEGPTRAYLLIINRNPQAVLKASKAA